MEVNCTEPSPSQRVSWADATLEHIGSNYANYIFITFALINLVRISTTALVYQSSNGFLADAKSKRPSLKKPRC